MDILIQVRTKPEQPKHKFRDSGLVEYKGMDLWENKIYKPVFFMTKSYKGYLHEKELYDLECDINRVNRKMEFTQRTYGEIDEFDLQELQYLINKYYKLMD